MSRHGLLNSHLRSFLMTLEGRITDSRQKCVTRRMFLKHERQLGVCFAIAVRTGATVA